MNNRLVDHECFCDEATCTNVMYEPSPTPSVMVGVLVAMRRKNFRTCVADGRLVGRGRRELAIEDGLSTHSWVDDSA